MAKINLHIEADSPEDLQSALRGLAGRAPVSEYAGVGSATDLDNSGDAQASEEAGNAAAPGTRTRRTKAQIAADNAAQAAATDSTTAASATNASTASPEAGSASTATPSLIDQVNRANDEAAVSGATPATKEGLMGVMQKHMAAFSAKLTQDALEKSAGARRISEVTEDKFAAAIAHLESEIAALG